MKPDPHNRDAWFVAAVLVALQVPFLLTRHIQEDAYITLRCAMNLADTGVYGFNAGERVSASTSHLSVFTIALLRLLSGGAFIWLTQVVYGVATVVGLYLLTSAVVVERRQRIWAWAIASALPVSLIVAYGGMETALLVLLVGMILRATTLTRFSRWCAVGFVLLPWARPDAVAIGLLVLAVAASTRRAPWRVVSAYGSLLLAGAVSWALFNQVYFGTVLTQTILGKAAVWLPSAPGDAVSRGLTLLGQKWIGGGSEPGVFVPIQTKFLTRFAVPAMLLTLAGNVWLCARSSRFGADRVPVAALMLIAYVLPAVYALGGVIYPWYLWPSQLAASLLVVVLVTGWLARQPPPLRRAAGSAGIALVGLLAAGQWLFAVSWGTQERFYRGGIGERLKTMSARGDTLLLEPAGYVPFYSQLFTWDEIGLASPAVTQYRTAFGQRWWTEFVGDKLPTFLLERRDILKDGTLDGYVLSSDEQAWFNRHYRLVQVFKYNPSTLRKSDALNYIASFGSAEDYRLYQSIQGAVD